MSSLPTDKTGPKVAPCAALPRPAISGADAVMMGRKRPTNPDARKEDIVSGSRGWVWSNSTER